MNVCRPPYRCPTEEGRDECIAPEVHDNLHMRVGLDMSRLISIELFFHMTLLACGLTLAPGLLRIA
jgi:hypothetical protein